MSLLRKREIRPATVIKYANCLLEIATAKSVNMIEVIEKYKLTGSLTVVLTCMHLIVKGSDHRYKWIGSDPDTELVETVIENVRIHNLTSRVQISEDLPVVKPPETKHEREVQPVQTPLAENSPLAKLEPVTPDIAAAAAMAAELAIKLGKKDIRGFVQGVLMSE